MIEWLGNHHLSFFYIQSHSQYSHSLFLFCSVADINQSLIDDGLVNKEKIGGSNYFWSFPAARDRKMQLEHAKVKEDIQDLKQKVAEASAKLADAKRGREDEDGERAKKLQRLKDLAEERKKAEAELATLKENDPQALADLEKELQLVKAAANRWTDNIFTCKAYLVKKKNMGKKEADAMLGITSAFDCKCMALSLVYYIMEYSHVILLFTYYYRPRRQDSQEIDSFSCYDIRTFSLQFLGGTQT
jgi:plasmid stabilization system protein ParE